MLLIADDQATVAGIPPWYVTKPSRPTQPCIPVGLLNRVPALIGWGKGGNVTSAGWQVTLCDPIWHVSSCSGAVLVAQTAIHLFTFLLLYPFSVLAKRLAGKSICQITYTVSSGILNLNSVVNTCTLTEMSSWNKVFCVNYIQVNSI